MSFLSKVFFLILFVFTFEIKKKHLTENKFIFPEVKLVSAYKNTSFRQAERITLRSPKASRKLSLSSKSLDKSGTSSPTASPKPTRKLRIVSAVSKAYFTEVLNNCPNSR